jgi:hypothetical protein
MLFRKCYLHLFIFLKIFYEYIKILRSGVKSQQQQAPHAKKSDEASKIYYAPDERDDFDDEDPDEDLNF